MIVFRHDSHNILHNKPFGVAALHLSTRIGMLANENKKQVQIIRPVLTKGLFVSGSFKGT